MSNLLYVLATDPLPLVYVVISGTGAYYALKAYCFERRRQSYRLERSWRNPR